MKFDSWIGQIIAAKNIDRFSTGEIRTALLAVKRDWTSDSNQVRRYVYAELLKLVKRGWLRKSISNKKGITSFIKTEKFDGSAFEVTQRENSCNPQNTTNENVSSVNAELIERLHIYKSNLLTGLGEAQEYKKLCEQYPNMHKELQPKYNTVRENNSRLLGQIKAIETIIPQKQ